MTKSSPNDATDLYAYPSTIAVSHIHVSERNRLGEAFAYAQMICDAVASTLYKLQNFGLYCLLSFWAGCPCCCRPWWAVHCNLSMYPTAPNQQSKSTVLFGKELLLTLSSMRMLTHENLFNQNLQQIPCMQLKWGSLLVPLELIDDIWKQMEKSEAQNCEACRESTNVRILLLQHPVPALSLSIYKSE